MSRPSNWPLAPGAVRFIVPKAVTDALAAHSLARDLYPTSMGFYPQARGHSMRRSEHDDWLFLYCVEGRATAEIGGREYPVTAGDLLALPLGVPHAYWAADDDPWTVYWIHFTGRKAAAYLRHVPLRQNRFVYPLGVRAGLVSDFKLLLEARRSPYHVKTAVHAAHVLRALYCNLALIWTATPPDRSQLDLDRIHALMERRLEGALCLDELAAATHLSKYQFAHEYRRQTGVSPIAHFIRLKVERACHLLDTTELSLKEIGDALGYADRYYFSRIFKKVMGYAPDHYRRLNKG